MTRFAAILLASLTVLSSGALFAADTAPLPDGLYAELTTPRGPITCELFYQKTPITVASFVGLAEGTLGPAKPASYFDGLSFHRVVPGFVVQGGDPLGNGDGGPGYTIPDELVPGLRHDDVGILSMANSGPDTGGSQFFLTLAPVNRLNYLHTIFGRTVRGREVLAKIAQGDKLSVKIVRVGAAAKSFRADEATFVALCAKAKKYTGAQEPGPTALFDDQDHILPVEPPRAKAFTYKLGNFERATGVKIAARIFAKSPSAAEDAKPGAFMHALAEQLGVAKNGVLAAYFADDKDWRIWIGDGVTATFLGHPPSAKDLAEDGALHEVKTAFIKAATAQGDADFAAQVKAAPADKPVPPAQQIKLQTDAMLDGLIFKLEPK
jgi:cyclophilin family peptidyl-prolyl cis-trans isomerase